MGTEEAAAKALTGGQLNHEEIVYFLRSSLSQSVSKPPQDREYIFSKLKCI